MNPADLELALKKQRLQFQSASQRAEFACHAAALAPVLGLADRARKGVLWLRRHPQVSVAVAVALLVARPRAVLRWVGRAIFGWRATRKARLWLEALR